MHKKITTLALTLLFINLLAACTPAEPTPTAAPTAAAPGGNLHGEWVRTEATIKRMAGPDQPVVQTPFTVLGTYLMIDENAGTFTENTASGYYLEGAQAELWECDLAGSYSIPADFAYTSANAGVISWKPETLDTLFEAMSVPWKNVCIFNDIPSALDDHTPLIATPIFSIEFELLDENTLQLFISFESEYAEPGVTVTVERTYIYERAD